MQEVRNRIEGILAKILETHQVYLVDIQLRGEGRGKVVTILVDTDSGITIDKCAEISRELARQLDTQEIIQGSYRLEVSSPGIDQPLKLLRQYPKCVGRSFLVRYRADDTQQEIKGVLGAVEGTSITIVREAGESVQLRFESIIEAKEQLPW